MTPVVRADGGRRAPEPGRPENRSGQGRLVLGHCAHRSAHGARGRELQHRNSLEPVVVPRAAFHGSAVALSVPSGLGHHGVAADVGRRCAERNLSGDRLATHEEEVFADRTASATPQVTPTVEVAGLKTFLPSCITSTGVVGEREGGAQTSMAWRPMR